MGDKREDCFIWFAKEPAAWLKAHPELVEVTSFAGNLASVIGVFSGAYGWWAARQQAELLRDIKRGFNQKIAAAVIELKNYIHGEFLNQAVTDSMANAFTAIGLLGNIATKPRDLQVSLLGEAAGYAETAYNHINAIQDKKERAYFGPQILFCALTCLSIQIVESTLFTHNILHQELSFQRGIDEVLRVSREMIRIIPEIVKERFGEVEKKVEHYPGFREPDGPPVPGSYEVWIWYSIDGIKKYLSGRWHFSMPEALSADKRSARIDEVFAATIAERERVLTSFLQEAEERLGGYEDAVRYCRLLALGTKFDAAYQGIDGKQRFFCRGRYLDYNMTTDTVIGASERIDTKFKGIIGRIDAAFQVLAGQDKGKTYLFQGNQHYRYNEDYILEAGYPKLISDRWHQLGDSIDTVFQDATTGRIYFFKGEDFIVYKADDVEMLSAGYPKKISNHWSGVWTNRIDAIVNRNGKLYIFQDEHYVRCNLATKTVEGAIKKTQNHWPGLNFMNSTVLMLSQPELGSLSGLSASLLPMSSSMSASMSSSSSMSIPSSSSSMPSSDDVALDGLSVSPAPMLSSTSASMFSSSSMSIPSSSSSMPSSGELGLDGLSVSPVPMSSFGDMRLLSNAPSATLFVAGLETQESEKRDDRQEERPVILS